MARTTHKRAALQAHVEAAAAKGVPISRYAASHGLSPQSLYAARRRKRAGAFVRVHLNSTPVAAPSTLQVRLPNGIIVACAVEGACLPASLPQRPGGTLMFSFSPTAEVCVHRAPVDFRKQINGLAVIVQARMALDPMREALVVFTNRRADGIKVLWRDRNGFCLWMKRLEAHRFVWPVQRHAGEDTAVLAARHRVYTDAKTRNPERWSGHTRNWTPVGPITLNPEHDTVIGSQAG